MNVEFPIGTQYYSRGKNSKLCTIIDILKTYNNKGELVNIRYVSTHQFLGQTVTEKDVLPITIQRAEKPKTKEGG